MGKREDMQEMHTVIAFPVIYYNMPLLSLLLNCTNVFLFAVEINSIDWNLKAGLGWLR